MTLLCPPEVSRTAGVRLPARRGFTMIELLVVVAILAVLVAVLLPALQSSRESARRTHCLNNSRQIGIAMLGFESANGFYAPANSTGAGKMWPPNNPGEHGMFAMLLPYLEGGAVLRAVGYDFNHDWDAAVNRAAAQAIIPTFACISTPAGPRKITPDTYPTNPLRTWQPACNDYATIVAVENSLYAACGATPPAHPKQKDGMLPTNTRTVAAHIRDGLSNTLAIVECGNRPLRHFNGRPMAVRAAAAGSPCDRHNDTLAAAWADNGATFPLKGSSAATGIPNSECYHPADTGRVPPSGTSSGGQCVMNCTNSNEPYSFHPGGINVTFGDGGTRFLSQDIAPLTMAALVTRMGREILEAY